MFAASLHPPKSTQVEILGISVTGAQPQQARSLVESACLSSRSVSLAYGNAHTLNVAASDPTYFDVLRQFTLVFNDGIGLDLAARCKGVKFPANLNGSDFTPLLLEMAAERNWPVYLLGGRPGVAEKAASRLAGRIPGLEVVGCRDGYFAPEAGSAVAAEIRDLGPEVVLVGMGNPSQELWLSRHLSITGARLGVGVGAFLDFAAGTVPRAPGWMNEYGLEWVFRMLQEPKRMWRRYVLGNPLFLTRVLRARFNELRGA